LLPHLVDSPSAGGAVGANGNHLADILNKAETARGTPFAFGLLTWADRVAPRMIFDQASVMQVTTIKKIPKNKTKSLDDALVITSNSSSTVNHSASTMGASKIIISSGHTLASQDFSVALSDMKSVMTGMFDRQDAFVRQAAKEAKEAAHETKMEAKEAAKEAKETAIAAAKAAEAQRSREAAREVAKEYKEASNNAKQDAKEAAVEMRNFLQTMMKMMLSGQLDSSTPKRKLDQVC
jgi:hypothetical protein